MLPFYVVVGVILHGTFRLICVRFHHNMLYSEKYALFFYKIFHFKRYYLMYFNLYIIRLMYTNKSHLLSIVPAVYVWASAAQSAAPVGLIVT